MQKNPIKGTNKKYIKRPHTSNRQATAAGAPNGPRKPAAHNKRQTNKGQTHQAIKTKANK
jgi:hypothetical protein